MLAVNTYLNRPENLVKRPNLGHSHIIMSSFRKTLGWEEKAVLTAICYCDEIFPPMLLKQNDFVQFCK